MHKSFWKIGKFGEKENQTRSFGILGEVKEFKKFISKYSYKSELLHFSDKKELSKELLTLIMFLKMLEKEVNDDIKSKEKENAHNYYI